MYKIGIIGNFWGDKEATNGQTIKTKIIEKELEKNYKKENIINIDTYESKKHLFRTLKKTIEMIKTSENIIMLPAHNALKFFAPLLSILNKVYKKKLHYIVIGGWLPELLEKNKFLENSLKQFNYIYVETKSMERKMHDMGFTNVEIMPNFKRIDRVSSNELKYNNKRPLKLCIFSRILYEKGIEDAINAIIEINQSYKETYFILDIYGKIDVNYENSFTKLMKDVPSYIKYCDVIPFYKSVEVIQNYYALLFPTRFYTEGIPGTIIDAYASGVPVISSRWENYSDMIVEGKTGVTYEFNNVNCLKKILIQIIEGDIELNKCKENCLEKALIFTPEKAMRVLINNLN